MSSLIWLWDQISGHFIWWVMVAVVGFLYTKTRPWLERAKQWVVALFRKKAGADIQITASKTPKLDAIGIWFLVLAIILLSLWGQKLQNDVHQFQVEMISYALPRQLTKEQINAFGKYLLSHSQPHEVRI